jgi:DNA-binding transcriptional LysR family regulator
MDRQSVEDKLVQNQIHIGVLSLSSRNKDLEYWTLLADAMVLIVGTTHPWAKRDRIAPEELGQAEWILREGGAATRQLVLATLAERGMRPEDLHVAMELGSVEGVEAAVEAGHGVSFVSRIAVQRGLDLGRIKVVPVDGMNIQREIYLARNCKRACTCAQLKFREFVASPEGKEAIAQAIR